MAEGNGQPAEPEWGLIYSDGDDVEAAHREWNLVISELRDEQTLSVANGHAIRRLVDFRIQYERAVRQVAEDGPMIKSKGRGKPAHWNPYWAVMRHAEKVIRSIETELGISPLRRSRAGKVTKRAQKTRPADAYLKKAAS